MNAWGKVLVLLGALPPLLVSGAASAAGVPVTVECSLKLRYAVREEVPSVDAVNRYVCDAKLVASSDVDATNAVAVASRQVVFGLGGCPRLPAMIVFGDRDVTEVRELRLDRTRAHLFSGECKRCVMTPDVSVVNAPRFDSGHFDARFVVRPYEPTPDDASITLPAGKGLLSLRAERTDDAIATGLWSASRCKIVSHPPIFCGGIAGILCPEGMKCVDWPEDDCDPDAGGADCIGMCVVDRGAPES
jgi:hypothetical protein